MSIVNEFVPFKGIQNVSFGLSRALVRGILDGNEYRNFMRNEFAQSSTDFYMGLGFFVEYDVNDECVAIEFSDGSNLYLEGKNLFDYSYEQVRMKYDALSIKKELEENFGITYLDLGFGLSKMMEGNVIETIIIFNKNYWS